MRDLIWNLNENDLSISRIQKDMPGIKAYGEGLHEMGQKNHRIEMYKFQIAKNVFLYWSYCPDCKVIWTKKVIGFDNTFEDGNNGTAYLREFVKNGDGV